MDVVFQVISHILHLDHKRILRNGHISDTFFYSRLGKVKLKEPIGIAPSKDRTPEE